MKTQIVLILLGLGVLAAAIHASDDEYQTGKDFLKSAVYPLYKEECGSCHLAYPPGLLHNSGWQKIMDGLDKHFGDNAELDKEVHQQLMTFLLKYSKSRTGGRSSTGPVIRISQSVWFTHEHDEIPARMIKGNDKVRSLSNCQACHRQAEQGSFREREINIPGYGHWDD